MERRSIEDIWIEGQVPESVKQLLEIKQEMLRAKEFGRSLLDGAETISNAGAYRNQISRSISF